MWPFVIVCPLCLVTVVMAAIEQMPLPVGMQDCFDRYAQKTSIAETVGEAVTSFCYGQYMWRSAADKGLRGFNVTKEAYDWVNGLLNRGNIRRRKRQIDRRRVRKEYRRLTDEERANYHRAIQLLKTDTSVFPNRYDALSAIHQGIVVTSAHGGPNFLGFHRVFVLMFENALREKVPGVTVPYWDSTLDEPLPNPAQSIMFTEPFLGNPHGMVTSGPHANWITLSGPLIRNVGQSGEPFRLSDIQRIMTRVRLAEITEPMAPVNSSLEFHHNSVHLLIDGQMGELNTAAHDPVFWLHHSYVDYVWEQFRQNQRRNGIDPERDYPPMVNDPMHRPGFAMGLSNFRNIDGLSDRFTRLFYRYEPAPICSHQFPDCGSPYLRCLIVNRVARCVSADWSAARRVPFPVQRFMPDQRQIMRQQMMAAQQQQSMISAAAMRQQQSLATSQALRTRQLQLQMAAQRQLQQRHLQQQMVARRVNSPGREQEIEDAKRKKRSSGIHTAMPRHARSGAQSNHKEISQFQSLAHQAQFSQFQNVTALSQSSLSCPALPTTDGYQNTFNINGLSDIGQWVYIPVKVVYQRPPTYVTYTSYPIVNGKPSEKFDIYSPSAYSGIRGPLATGQPACYSKCSSQSAAAGKVYLHSQGINYMGSYKEYTIVDHRLAISIATAYVAVKSPTHGASEVFLSAYDSCGRVCQPYCKMAGTSFFQRCSGVFRVTSSEPKMYGSNFGDAVTNLWHFSNSGACPYMSEERVYIQFYCNFRDAWPFTMATAQSTPMQVAPRDQTGPTADSMSMFNATSQVVAACHVGQGCVIRGPCTHCSSGLHYACAGTCSKYTYCLNGAHHIQRCPPDTKFDSHSGRCIPGSCFPQLKQWW